MNQSLTPTGATRRRIATAVAVACSVWLAACGARPHDELPPGWTVKTSTKGRVQLIRPNGNEVWVVNDNMKEAIWLAWYLQERDQQLQGETWSASHR
jgi:hypothetical protein